MFRRFLGLTGAVALGLSVTGPVYADEVKGKITNVGDEGRNITVATKEGKEVKVKISGSRTSVEGVKSRSELKQGQNVQVEHEGGEAKKVKVLK